MTKKIKSDKTYKLTAPRGDEILILQTPREYSRAEMHDADKKLRAHYPGWTGMLLILKPTESLDRISEPAARELLKGLKQRFEHEAEHVCLADDCCTPAEKRERRRSDGGVEPRTSRDARTNHRTRG